MFVNIIAHLPEKYNGASKKGMLVIYIQLLMF